MVVKMKKENIFLLMLSFFIIMVIIYVYLMPVLTDYFTSSGKTIIWTGLVFLMIIIVTIMWKKFK